MKYVIYAHPSKAKTKGKTFTTSALASRKELNQLGDILDRQQMYKNVHFGILSTVVLAPLKSKGFSITGGIAAGMLSNYSGNTNAKIVSNALKKSSKSYFVVKITYSYRQTGSNDGYYIVSKVSII